MDAFKFIHFLPPLFVSAIFVLGIGGFFLPLLWKALVVIVGLYLIYTLLGAVVTTAKIKKVQYVVALPIIFATMQISWGIGFIVGIAKTYK